MTTIAAPTIPAADREDAPPPPILRQLGIDSAYVLLGFPLAIVTFVIIITGLSLGLSLLITLIGIPVLVATVYAARGFAEVERARIAAVLRSTRVRVRYKTAAAEAGWWRRMFVPLSDIQSWLDVFHAVFRFPIAVTGFCV